MKPFTYCRHVKLHVPRGRWVKLVSTTIQKPLIHCTISNTHKNQDEETQRYLKFVMLEVRKYKCNMVIIPQCCLHTNDVAFPTIKRDKEMIDYKNKNLCEHLSVSLE